MVFWLLAWTAGGVFFALQAVPLVASYSNNFVTTTSSDSAVEDGLDFPVVTFCPRGSGLRCDCDLWKDLLCHARAAAPSSSQAKAFGVFERYTCIDFNASTALSCGADGRFQPPDGHGRDPCGRGLLSSPELFSAMVARSANGSSHGDTEVVPYLKTFEVLDYAAKTLEHDVVALLATSQAIAPSSWWSFRVAELASLTLCAQLVVPFEDPRGGQLRQRLPGAHEGLVFLVVQREDEAYYSKRDIAQASPSFSVFADAHLPCPRCAASVTAVGYVATTGEPTRKSEQVWVGVGTETASSHEVTMNQHEKGELDDS